MVLWGIEACCRLIIADIDGTKGLAGTAQSCHGICNLKLGGRLFISTRIAFNRSQQFQPLRITAQTPSTCQREYREGQR